MAGGSVGQALALDDETLWQFRKTLLGALAAPTLDAFGLATEWNHYVEEAGKEGGRARGGGRHWCSNYSSGCSRTPSAGCMGFPRSSPTRPRPPALEKVARRIGPDKLMAWIDRAADADLQVDRKVQLELVIEAFADALAR